MIPIEIISRRIGNKNPYTGACNVYVTGKVATTGEEFQIIYRSAYELALFKLFCKNPEVKSISYEGYIIKYTDRKADKTGKWIEIEHTYMPDFVINADSKGMVLIEAKGKFDKHNIRKFQAIRQQHPAVKIYFMLWDYNQQMVLRGKTMFVRDWLTEHGYKYGWGYKMPNQSLYWLKPKYKPRNSCCKAKENGVTIYA